MLSLVTYSNTDINNYSNVLVFVKKKKKVTFLANSKSDFKSHSCNYLWSTLMTFANFKKYYNKTISTNKEK